MGGDGGLVRLDGTGAPTPKQAEGLPQAVDSGPPPDQLSRSITAGVRSKEATTPNAISHPSAYPIPGTDDICDIICVAYIDPCNETSHGARF